MNYEEFKHMDFHTLTRLFHALNLHFYGDYTHEKAKIIVTDKNTGEMTVIKFEYDRIVDIF